MMMKKLAYIDRGPFAASEGLTDAARLASALFLATAILLGMTLASLAQPEIWRNQGWAETDFTKTSVDYDAVLSGGPPKDGIPSIDNPSFWSLVWSGHAGTGGLGGDQW